MSPAEKNQHAAAAARAITATALLHATWTDAALPAIAIRHLNEALVRLQLAHAVVMRIKTDAGDEPDAPPDPQLPPASTII